MDNLFLTPPFAFIILLIASLLFLALISKFSYKTENPPEDQKKPYACGEDVTQHRLQPDYSQFFPFAFFFTIMHVVALILTTMPLNGCKSSGIALFYLLSAIIGLSILYRK